jgi:hypothetical protein
LGAPARDDESPTNPQNVWKHLDRNLREEALRLLAQMTYDFITVHQKDVFGDGQLFDDKSEPGRQ